MCFGKFQTLFGGSSFSFFFFASIMGLVLRNFLFIVFNYFCGFFLSSSSRRLPHSAFIPVKRNRNVFLFDGSIKTL